MNKKNKGNKQEEKNNKKDCEVFESTKYHHKREDGKELKRS